VSGSSNFDQKERNLLPSSLAQVFVIINILFKGLQKSILTKKEIIITKRERRKAVT